MENEIKATEEIKQIINPLDFNKGYTLGLNYMDNSNCLMSNTRLTAFSWQDETKKAPELTFNVKVSVQVKPFMEYVKMLDRLDIETVKLSIDKDNQFNLILSHDWETPFNRKNRDSLKETFKGQVTLNTLETDGFKQEVVNTESCGFSVEFLNAYFKSLSKQDIKGEVTLMFKTDYFLILDIKGVWLIMAPRITND